MKLKALLFGAVDTISLSLSIPAKAWLSGELWAVQCTKYPYSLWDTITDNRSHLEQLRRQCKNQGGSFGVEYIGDNN